MIVFLLLSFLSKKFKDRTLVLVGLIGNLSTLIFLIIYLPMAVPLRNKPLDYLLFMLPIFGNVFSLPFIVLGSISLLSKISSLSNQGLTQGIRRTVVGIACILGPNWAGSYQMKTFILLSNSYNFGLLILFCVFQGIFYKEWYLLIGSLIALLLLSLIMLLISYKRLNSQQSSNN